MNKFRKVFSVNLQLIILFLGLGVFSVFSLVSIIWYNNRVEQSNEFINQLEKLVIWNEGITKFYNSNEIDRYAKPTEYRDFDHLLADFEVTLIGDIENQIDNKDSNSVEDNHFRLNAKRDILFYTIELWGGVKKKIDNLNNENNYELLDLKKYKKDTVYIEKENNAFESKIVFREFIEKKRILKHESAAKLKHININLLNIKDQLLELLRLVRIENQSRVDRYHFMLWLITFMDTFIFVVAYFIIWRKVILPLRISKKEGEEVYQLGFTSQLSYNRNDEIGSLTQLINQLVQDIKFASVFTKQLRSKDTGSLDLAENNRDTPLFQELISLRNDMKEIEIKEFERSWNISGQTIFSDILTKYNNDFDKLVDVLIERLVKYLKGLQGGFFLLETNDEVLFLASVYAYDRKKYEVRRIEKGDGIVGQVWQEGKTAHVQNIPKTHTVIQSGLGEASPKSLLVVPLLDGDVLYGVIELASFNEFKSYEIEFVEKICENIATTLASVRVNEQTQLLLKESQMLTEQMKIQEDNMKQNLKELQGAQEELKLRDIQRENELKYTAEKFSKEIEVYKAKIESLEEERERIERDKKEENLNLSIKDTGPSESELAEVEEKYKSQILDLEETLKIKEMRIEKMRKKIAKLQGED